MKYAVISDIHGNLSALQAVLADARRQGITRYLFAGDYCISGPQPDECITALREIPGAVIIRGNEEKYLENLIGADPSLWTDGQMQVTYWTFRNMSRDNLDFLLGLPHRADLEQDGVRIHMAHCSDAFLGTYPFYTWNSLTVAERVTSAGAVPEEVLEGIRREREEDPEFRRLVSELEPGVYVFGHSHVQWTFRDRERGVYLVNPGSCGLPLDGIRDSVPYTVLEISGDGEVTVEEKRVPFDKQAYISALTRTGQYREARPWSRAIMRELAFAREHIHYFLGFTENYAREIGDERRPFAPDTWEKAFELWEQQQEEQIMAE